ncbi:hypothetical protein IAR55_003156 [Kwoniella newhampshirensis]|uniref:Autophagy-related protein 9 n=1 Tax=Kwoniella newhampshirensis TaxID=1651941 RepID=A0AAW0Z1I1_9TREE
MAPSTPPQSNSLLNLLNPYSSVARSSYPFDQLAQPDPDSPSTMLLRELQGGPGDNDDDDDEDEDGGPANDGIADGRERMSPTPTPSTWRPTHVIATPSTSSDDDEAPPRSIMFGAQPAVSRDRTPRSPPSLLPGRTQPFAAASSPGPFRPAPGPPSSSTSDSQSQSRSTSPGPSTISVYASGMEGTGIGGSSMPDDGSREPSTSPEQPSARLPTFRQPAPVVRPSPPRRTYPTASKKPHSSPLRLTNGPGYLDPSVPPLLSKGKGKVKATDKAGRKYQSLPAQEEGDDDGEQESERGRYAGLGGVRRGAPSRNGLNDYEKALWKWVNVEDLDGFLQEVYEYYKGKGIYCIALARVLNLLTTFFVIAFSTFLSSCIDYTKLTSLTSGPNAVGRLDDVLSGQCITHGSFPHTLFIISVSAFYIFQLSSFVMSLPRLLEMYRFYTHLLGIPDADIQTLPWPEIVRLIGEIRKHNAITSLSNGQAGALADMVGDDANKGPVKKLDAHDVANRILRQENYLIALFNKDLLDLRVRLPVPRSLNHLVPSTLLAPSTHAALPSHSRADERKYISFGANTLTKALEWNLRFCLMGYLFDRRGQVRKEFVRERRRKDLVEGLRRRFIFMGVLNAIFAPFIVLYLLMYSFFRYFEEYHKNPSSIGGRQYTPYAQWKFREFNELPHLFERRLDRSYPIAKEYIDQFPKERTALVMRFVAFVAGSFAAVLLVASLIDPDLFLHFEITPHRTVLFYLGVFGSVLAMARGMVPEENMVFDPEASLREVVRWTHYLPVEWREKLHSQKVHQEFGTLFALKINVFFTELLSVILTPSILFFSLPPCAGAIIDFVREFSVHVDGVGYVCSFAVFDFRRHGDSTSNPTANVANGVANGHNTDLPRTPLSPNAILRSPRANRDWRANENKMEKSFLHFKATHPDWQPTDPSSSMFLDRLVGIHRDKDRGQSSPIPGQGGMIGSTYAGAGGRGLGLGGMDEMRLRERSKIYDRAWAKSSHLLRPKNPPVATGLGIREDSVIEEEEDDEGDEGGADGMRGWNKDVDDEGRRQKDRENEGDEEGLWRDEGVVGLLQQVLGRGA